jgi:CheY-like chemotaxis protein
MSSENILKDKLILVVDDEPDILEAIAEQLDMCRIETAQDYHTAIQLLASYTFDIVILDIMGVDGFSLLKDSVSRGFPTVMLTAHALSPEALKESIKLGAVSFLPKEKMADLDIFLEDVVLGGGQSVWDKLFDRLGNYFSRRFGDDWREKDAFFKTFEEELKSAKNEKS